MSMSSHSTVMAAAAFAVLCACGPSDGERAQATIRSDILPRIQAIIDRDIEAHEEGIALVAERLAPGFRVEDPVRREEQMRIALKRMRRPVGGVRILVATAMSFLAAVDANGVCIARDKTPDLMRGRDFGAQIPLVRRALSGEAGRGVVEFASEGDAPPNFAITFVHPVRQGDEVVGAIMGGIPFGRMAGRISRQIQLEDAAERRRGMALWVYFYHGDHAFQFGVPPDLHSLVPDAAVRRAGLEGHPSGFGGVGLVYGREYGWVVVPLEALGPEGGVIVLRGQPVD